MRKIVFSLILASSGWAFGQGAFGEVVHVRKIETNREYAMKIVDKKNLKKVIYQL